MNNRIIKNYVVNNNEITITYSKTYKFPQTNRDYIQFESYDFLIKALYFAAFKNIKYNSEYQEKDDCAICYNSEMCVNIDVVRCSIHICKQCINKECKLNYTREYKHIKYKILNVNKIESTDDKLIYYYTIRWHNNDIVSYDKIINDLFKSKKKACLCCYDRNQYCSGACYDCYYFLLTKYYQEHWSGMLYFKRDMLLPEITNIISDFYILLLNITPIM